MLVTLGVNQAIGAGGSITLPYACRSVQKIFLKADDTSGTDVWTGSVSIQLGQRTIMNNASFWGINGYQGLQGGVENSTTEGQFCIDLGSHQLLDNENLYVTIRASLALTAVDVSALVDEPSAGEYPVRYTEYQDTTFTAENVLSAICYRSSRSEIDEDTNVFEMRDAVSSSSPSIISANNWYAAECQNNAHSSYYGLLQKKVLPLTTTFNYSSASGTDRVLVASQMGTSQRAVRQSRNAQRIAQSQVGK